MTTDSNPPISRRAFNRLAAGAAATSGLASTPEESAGSPESANGQDRQVPGGYDYDVVIVGGGCAGALAASKLAHEGFSVLILEAGRELRHPADKVSAFYEANPKVPSSPWPRDKEANSPTVLDMGSTRSDDKGPPDWLRPKDSKGNRRQVIQHDKIAAEDAGTKNDPRTVFGDDFVPEYVPFNSTYSRLGGGSTNHWQGIALRHVPNDLELHSGYAKKSGNLEFSTYARDWPIKYDELEKWYRMAEWEVGVAGDESYDNNLGAWHSRDEESGTAYPMPAIALSYQDLQFKKKVEGRKKIVDRAVQVLPLPQARNSVDRDGRPPCQGNSSCIPICPIQAKYDATVHLKKAATAGDTSASGCNATIEYQSVAWKVEVDTQDGDRVSRIHYRRWGNVAPHDEEVTARTYVLAAHAIETAKLLLISPWKKSDRKDRNYKCVANSSDQVGRNLMDHIVYIAWGYAEDPVYPYRGPLATAGINDFRDQPGDGVRHRFDRKRRSRAAYRISIANDSWSWPVPAEINAKRLISRIVEIRIKELIRKMSDEQIQESGLDRREILESLGISDRDMGMMYNSNLKGETFGDRLRSHVRESMIRQVRVGAELEALPLPDSRVTVSSKIDFDNGFKGVPCEDRDELGIPRPHVHYRISEYTKKGVVESVTALDKILRGMGAVNLPDAPEGHPDKRSIHSRIVLDEDGLPSDMEPGTVRTIKNFTNRECTSNVIRYRDRDHKRKRYEYGGAGHIMGTFRMGDDPTDSVVDRDCRCHDHDNLFLLGSGVFPSSGTANPTLTIMALALRAADTIAKQLAAEESSATV